MGLRIIDRHKNKPPLSLDFENETRKWLITKHDYNEEKYQEFLKKVYSARERLKTGEKDTDNVKESLELAEFHIKIKDSESTKSQKPVDLGTMLELLELNR